MIKIIKQHRRGILGWILFLGLVFSLLPISMNSLAKINELTKNSGISTVYSCLNASTFFGGSFQDKGNDISIASDGSYYITGYTYSSDFPDLDAYDNTHNGFYDAFIAKFHKNRTLQWSTYFGGSADDCGNSIDVGSDGSCYVTGWTHSSNFPTLNAYNENYGGLADCFIAKFSTDGNLLWSTYIGTESYEYGYSIAVTSDDSCYVTGFTDSSNFPTKDAYNDTFAGIRDGFISKFSTDGALLWSTFLGGSETDSGRGIALASDNSCYVTGYTCSINFPIMNAYQDTKHGSCDAFITKFTSDGLLNWSTYLGGSSSNELGTDIAVASDGSCYVTGETESSNFPTLNAYDSSYNFMCDSFVTKFSNVGSLLWSTFLGGRAYDGGFSIAVALDDSCLVTGSTYSSDFPTLSAFQKTAGNSEDAFITKFSTDGSLNWSTYLGRSGDDSGWGIASNSEGSCYITGGTGSPDFPTKNAYNYTLYGQSDVFITNMIRIEDHISPIIQNVQNNPTNPTDLEAITIQCDVTDNISGVNFVTLYYRINSDPWIGKNIPHITGTSYETTIGPFSFADVIDYYIFTEDLEGNNATNDNDGSYYNFSIISGDIIGPTITDIIHTPENPIANDTITISSTVIDDNGIQSVTLYYRVNENSWETSTLNETTGNTFQAILEMTLNTNDIIEYYIEAIDNSPNHNVAIKDNDGQYYSITIVATTKESSSTHNLVLFLLIMPILVIVLRKKQKR